MAAGPAGKCLADLGLRVGRGHVADHDQGHVSRTVIFGVKGLEVIESGSLRRGLVLAHRVRPVRVALREYRPAKGFLRARFGILRRCFQGADELLPCLVELLHLQGGRTQLRGDQPDHQRQILLQALGANLQ